MQKIAIMAFALISLCMSPSASQWIQIRTAYRTALTNNNHLSIFESACKTYSQTDPLAKAYYATALALRARASISPPNKLSLANQAESLLNAAATAQPQNLEIRVLRYTFEYGTPSMLNMKKNMTQDKPMAIKFAKSPSPIKDIAIAFLKDCDQLTESEKNALR
ncbi:MAG: hypothetical protein RLZZ146_382 [Bacteroidota bacterium]